MGKGRGNSRVSKVVGRDIDGLHRRDGALLGGGYPLLKNAHVGTVGRLVSNGRGHPAQKSGQVSPREGISEYVIDKDKNVLALVPEIFSAGQCGKRDPGPCSGRLVHLTVYERHFFKNS